jgi:diadenosine tetraphosphatase ApaH/serine/threonine PP2A family protein phosphatase
VKLALLADLHANLQATQACLADARSRGATDYAFLGDLVGYGGDPAAVVDLVMAHAARGAWIVRGNHDDAAIAPPVGDAHRADFAGAEWTHSKLSPAQVRFLHGLPLTLQQGNMLLVHASARQPQRWTYVTRAPEAADSMDAAQAMGASLVFCGHVHEQRLFYQGAVGKLMAFEPTPGVAVPVRAHREWLATIGSVGQPRDGDPRAMYALYDDAAAQLTFLRVPYDLHAAARAIRVAGLPDANAVRLGLGR